MTLAGDARTMMLVVKGDFDMRPLEGLVFIPLVPERTSEQILVRRRNVALSSAAEAFWAQRPEVRRETTPANEFTREEKPRITSNSGLCSSISLP